jgi:hypothetical protein
MTVVRCKSEAGTHETPAHLIRYRHDLLNEGPDAIFLQDSALVFCYSAPPRIQSPAILQQSN